jgi:hypothetical protein
MRESERNRTWQNKGPRTTHRDTTDKQTTLIVATAIASHSAHSAHTTERAHQLVHDLRVVHILHCGAETVGFDILHGGLDVGLKREGKEG